MPALTLDQALDASIREARTGPLGGAAGRSAEFEGGQVTVNVRRISDDDPDHGVHMRRLKIMLRVDGTTGANVQEQDALLWRMGQRLDLCFESGAIPKGWDLQQPQLSTIGPGHHVTRGAWRAAIWSTGPCAIELFAASREQAKGGDVQP